MITELLPLLDVIVDGEFIEERKNLRLAFRGSENQRILEVPLSNMSLILIRQQLKIGWIK